MIRLLTLSALPILILAAGCQPMNAAPSELVGAADIQRADGSEAGSLLLSSDGKEITLSIMLSGFDAGTQAVHLHTTGSCIAPDFTSAGGHLNPAGAEHGSLNPLGAHLGDLPNVVIGPDHMGRISAVLKGEPALVLSEIFDADGTAIMVHAKADDYRTDPTGAAGGRVACGVLRRL